MYEEDCASHEPVDEHMLLEEANEEPTQQPTPAVQDQERSVQEETATAPDTSVPQRSRQSKLPSCTCYYCPIPLKPNWPCYALGKRRREDDDLDFLDRRAEREHAVRQRQLDIEERKVQLEERRLQLEEDRLAFERQRFTEVELARIRVEEERARSHGQMLQLILSHVLQQSRPV